MKNKSNGIGIIIANFHVNTQMVLSRYIATKFLSPIWALFEGPCN